MGEGQAFSGADDARAAGLYGLIGLGDVGVGLLVLACPPLLGRLIGQALEPGGEIVARLLGCAAVALGLGWWRGRHRADARRTLRAGLLTYNLGAGAVFVLAAARAAEPTVPVGVAALHLGLGIVAARVETKVP